MQLEKVLELAGTKTQIILVPGAGPKVTPTRTELEAANPKMAVWNADTMVFCNSVEDFNQFINDHSISIISFMQHTFFMSRPALIKIGQPDNVSGLKMKLTFEE